MSHQRRGGVGPRSRENPPPGGGGASLSRPPPGAGGGAPDQRREWLRLRSRKTHSQVVEAHSLTRSRSVEVRRSAAERAISQSGRSSSSPSDGRDQPTPSRS